MNHQDRTRNLSFFEGLRIHQEEINSILGPLVWEPPENKKVCRIALARPGSIDDDDDALAEIQEWMVENLLKFREVFGPRLAELTK